ncbi:MAG TPA: hypothetical protein VJO99_25030, partial [Burkholderiaceae bacterium]|nr:hypothetical protein [Burkholderiaceae bacterium]
MGDVSCIRMPPAARPAGLAEEPGSRFTQTFAQTFARHRRSLPKRGDTSMASAFRFTRRAAALAACALLAFPAAH